MYYRGALEVLRCDECNEDCEMEFQGYDVVSRPITENWKCLSCNTKHIVKLGEDD